MRLIGHENVNRVLDNVISSDNVNRTFLFLGVKDSGKTFLGNYFASRLLDKRVWKQTHPDFFYFKGRQGKYIELLEDFLESCNKQPFESGKVVVFLDDIDLVPLSSLNVLLKTLEEPPSKTTIILSAKSQESLLDTIISRSFKFPLSPRTREEKEDVLFDMGVRDAHYRLGLCDDIKLCASKDFATLEAKVSFCFKRFDLFKTCKVEELPSLIQDFLETEDLRFFLESVRHKDSAIDFQFKITDFLTDCSRYNNKFLTLFNFIMYIRDNGL